MREAGVSFTANIYAKCLSTLLSFAVKQHKMSDEERKIFASESDAEFKELILMLKLTGSMKIEKWIIKYENQTVQQEQVEELIRIIKKELALGGTFDGIRLKMFNIFMNIGKLFLWLAKKII